MALCEKSVRLHLHYLERQRMIHIDRTEKPFSYEITAVGWIHILI